jgi:hypothetical protein
VERLPETEQLKKIKEIILQPVTEIPKIEDIIKKINNMDKELIKEAKIVYDSLKKNKEKDELLVKLEENSKITKQDKVIDPIQKNDAIAVDAIKKEELELAADKESKLQNNNENVKSMKNLSLNSNLNLKPIDSVIRESNDPVIKVLTKQSNKLSNENEVASIPKDDNKNVINLKNLKSDDKTDIKNKEYIPIVLKMNNQTKKNTESLLKNNKSNADFVAARRNILDEHQREKRMTHTEEIDSTKADFNITFENHNNNSANEKLVDYEEIYPPKGNELQKEHVEKQLKIIEPNNEKNIDNKLIKTSAYLSAQDVIKKVAIHSSVNEGSTFIKLKKRDLKTLKIESDNEK